jgi:hypothetical protein
VGVEAAHKGGARHPDKAVDRTAGSATIPAIVQRLPEATPQEDEKLLILYDTALMRPETGS